MTFFLEPALLAFKVLFDKCFINSILQFQAGDFCYIRQYLKEIETYSQHISVKYYLWIRFRVIITIKVVWSQIQVKLYQLFLKRTNRIHHHCLFCLLAIKAATKQDSSLHQIWVHRNVTRSNDWLKWRLKS